MRFFIFAQILSPNQHLERRTQRARLCDYWSCAISVGFIHKLHRVVLNLVRGMADVCAFSLSRGSCYGKQHKVERVHTWGKKYLRKARRANMAALRTYTEDLKIAKSLICRDESVTREYYYKDCYPLFKSIYDNYYTDCKCCKEFMDEIYIVVLAPSKITGKCQMENFKGESTLRTWLKIACLYYCYNKYELKKRMPLYEPLPHNSEKKDEDDDLFGDRSKKDELSNPIDFSGMNRADVETLLSMMPNTRYRNIIRLLYLEQKTHKEVAVALGMSMANYYNKRILAEKQYMQVCRKEEANV